MNQIPGCPRKKLLDSKIFDDIHQTMEYANKEYSIENLSREELMVLRRKKHLSSCQEKEDD